MGWKLTTRITLTLVWVLIFAAPAAADTLLFHDGQVHTINGTVAASVQVADGPGDQPTTLRVPEGASVQRVSILGHSVLKLDGGSVTEGLLSDGDARITLRGGTVGGPVRIWGAFGPPCEADGTTFTADCTISVGYRATLTLRNVNFKAGRCIEVYGRLSLLDCTCYGVPWVADGAGTIVCERCRFSGAAGMSNWRGMALPPPAPFVPTAVSRPVGVYPPRTGAATSRPALTLEQQRLIAARAAALAAQRARVLAQAPSSITASGYTFRSAAVAFAPPAVPTLDFSGDVSLVDCDVSASDVVVRPAPTMKVIGGRFQAEQLVAGGPGANGDGVIDLSAVPFAPAAIHTSNAETRLSADRAVLYRAPDGTLMLQRAFKAGPTTRAALDWPMRASGRVVVVTDDGQPLVATAAAMALTALPVGMDPPLAGDRSNLLSVVGLAGFPLALVLLGGLIRMLRGRLMPPQPAPDSTRLAFGRSATVSLALCASFALLWLRSATHRDVWLGARGGTIQVLSSDEGLLRFWSSPHAGYTTSAGWSYHHGPGPAPVAGLPPSRAPQLSATAGTPATLPYWLACLLTALWPVWRTGQLARAAWLRRRESRKTLCRRCGYDLRATPGRCPECGTVPAELAGAKAPS